MKKLIVGVDPGVTCGLAILTLDGKPVFVKSQRGWTLRDLLKTLTSYGEPVIVSSDVSPPSEFVVKISKNFDAVLFSPPIALGTIEKQKSARDYALNYDLKLDNAHEVDALAAAVKAFHHYKNKFEQIETHLKEMNRKVPLEDVKALVIKGYTIKRAVQLLSAKPEERKIMPSLRKRKPQEDYLKDLLKEMMNRLSLEREVSKQLKQRNRELRKKVSGLKKEISELKERIKEKRDEQLFQIRREREYKRLLDEINVLRRRLSESLRQIEKYKKRFNELQRLRELESSGKAILLKPIATFTKEGLDKAFKLYKIRPGDYVILLNASGGGASTAETLAKRGVKAIVTHTPMSHQARDTFAKLHIPIIPDNYIQIEWIGGVPYAKESSLIETIDKIRRTESNEALKRIENILEEHKREMIEKTRDPEN